MPIPPFCRHQVHEGEPDQVRDGALTICFLIADFGTAVSAKT
tara:strand:+ start:776 stop:901 length:126 start_codon:yes stop_codon:yes gene_type:complete